jgi:hypothetical protein
MKISFLLTELGTTGGPINLHKFMDESRSRFTFGSCTRFIKFFIAITAKVQFNAS